MCDDGGAATHRGEDRSGSPKENADRSGGRRHRPGQDHLTVDPPKRRCALTLEDPPQSRQLMRL
ncbi:hypothetical protein ACS0TY_018520 [Phlomoides rotata]